MTLIQILLLFVPHLGHDVLVVPTAERVTVPDVYVTDLGPVDEHEIQHVQTAIIDALAERGWDVRSANVLAEDPAGRWVPLPELLPPIEPPPARAWEMKGNGSGSPVITGIGSPGQVPGFLAGRTIYLSAGHGWTWNTTLGRWATQRGNTNNIVEDFVNHEGVHHYFIPMLQNAGATVFPVREPDKNTALVIVDETQAAVTGDWTSGPAGWDPAIDTMKSGTNPFAGGGTIQTVTTEEATATATFEASLPKSGTYGVNIAWSAGADRSPDVEVIVHHAGGQAVYQLDQRRHGSTWMFLGKLAFRADVPAKVVVTNKSNIPGGLVSVDAVRFGGGLGVVERGNGSFPAAGPTSGRPRWEENCRYHAQFQGAPKGVYDASGSDGNDDVGCRSRYSAWQHEEGEDAVFVSWHSNAPTPARGTSTWVYGPNPPNGQYIFTGNAGSDALAKTVHAEIIAAIKAEWDPNWKDRGIKSAWFGELNPNHNPEMPATLVEVAFHDTAEDAAYLAEPRFRRTLSRGYYRGIVRYFAERDGIEPQYAPMEPMHLRVLGTAEGAVSVRWEPSPEGQPATAYRVWTSTDGLGFSVVKNTPETQVVLDGLAPGVPVFVRVSATNEGGESFPTPTLGALPSCNDVESRALVVAGFTRIDAFSLPTEDMTPWSLGHPMRLDQDRVNTFDYTVEHGLALAAAGVPFDSTEATAVESGHAPLDGYAMVDWILGEQSTVDETFSTATQPVVAAYLGAGGRLFASGAELGWDLDEKGSDADKAFCAEWLKTGLAADSAETYELKSGATFHGRYDVEFADVLSPTGGATTLWTYATGGTAAVAFDGDFSVVTAGFPFEAIDGADTRAELMSQVVDALGFDAGIDLCDAPVEPDPPPGDEAGDSETGSPRRGPDAGGRQPTDPDAGTGQPGPPRGLIPSKVSAYGGSETESAGCRTTPGPSGAAPTTLFWLLGLCLIGLRALGRLDARHGS